MTSTHMERPSLVADLEDPDSWRSADAGRLAMADLHPTGDSLRSPRFDHRHLGDLMVTDAELPGVDGLRTLKTARQDPESLLVLTAFAGEALFETPQRTVLLRPDDLLIMTSRMTGRVVVPERLNKRTLRIPMTALAPFDTGRTIPDCLMLAARQNPLAALARAYVIGAVRQVEQMSPLEVESARNAVLTLTAGLIRATQPVDVGGNDFLPLLREQLEAWIVDHIQTGAIRVRDLASAHSVAPRTVHRAFALTGDTVGSIVRKHRLAGARSDLVNLRSSVATIAHRWGFCDASHLRREFRREFAMSPSDYREAYSIVPAR